jgi:hypothetical protein
MIEGSLKLLNWNLAGAKYLELPSEAAAVDGQRETRGSYRQRLNEALHLLIRNCTPDVITLQEVVCYGEDGREDGAKHVIDIPDDYDYYPVWLIDTRHHSATGKWIKYKKHWPSGAFLAQGNA